MPCTLALPTYLPTYTCTSLVIGCAHGVDFPGDPVARRFGKLCRSEVLTPDGLAKADRNRSGLFDPFVGRPAMAGIMGYREYWNPGFYCQVSAASCVAP